MDRADHLTPAHRLAWLWLTQLWPVPFVFADLAAVLDVSPYVPESAFWDSFFAVSAIACLCMIVWPVRAAYRYVAVFTTTAAYLSRATWLYFFTTPTPWIAVATWTASALAFATAAALSWYIVTHARRRF